MKKEFLENYRKEYPRHYVKMIVNNHKDYFNNALEFVKGSNLILNSNSKILYHYAFDILEIPKCNCGSEISSFSVNGNYGYNTFCGKSCAAKSKESIANRVKNRKANAIETIDSIKYNIRKSNNSISKQEFEDFIMSLDIDISNSDTIIAIKYPEMYNYFCKNYNESIQEVMFLIKNNDFKKHCELCNKPLRFISYNKGYTKGCSDKKCYSKHQSETKRIKYYKIWVDRLSSNDMTTSSTELDYIKHGELIISCNKCKFEFKRLVHSTIDAGCPNCSISKPQDEIKQYIENLGYKVSFNDRSAISPLELDIYIPDKNIAFEYCGLYWHSEDKENSVDKLYHFKKFKKCLDVGISLFTIFENEWISNKELVLKKIKAKLGYFSKKIRASKCSIVKLDNKTCKEFMDEYHIQGYLSSKHRYGLYYNGELVSAISFSIRNKVWEMTRFCNKNDYIVYGGLNKLFKMFINEVNPNTVKTFADLRWGSGNSYSKLGFKFKHFSKPNYFYYSKKESYNPKLYTRVGFQKHKLKNKLDKFDENQTEHQNMYNNGYRCIWDCGNSVWYWNKYL